MRPPEYSYRDNRYIDDSGSDITRFDCIYNMKSNWSLVLKAAVCKHPVMNFRNYLFLVPKCYPDCNKTTTKKKQRVKVPRW